MKTPSHLTCFLFSLLMFSSEVIAKSPVHSLQITTTAQGVLHSYRLSQDLTSQDFTLQFQQGERQPKKRVQTKKLTRVEGEALFASATRLLWSSKYRAPANLKKCSEYAQIEARSIANKLASKICTEDRKATGQMFGLLNQLKNSL